MYHIAGPQGLAFTFSLSDISATFRGADGRTGTRQAHPAPDSEPPSIGLTVGTHEELSRPSKRARTAAETEERTKRPVGRPPPSTSTAASEVPLAPPAEACERVILEEHYDKPNSTDPDDEADGSGEGGGDESDMEGDEEDPADVDPDDNIEEVERSSDPSGRQGSPAHAGSPRTPLPGWLQSAFDSCIQECRDRNGQGCPRLYWFHKTFWFPESYSGTPPPLQSSVLSLGSTRSYKDSMPKLQT
ncbi:hypothetical protein BKA70DRAFT_1227200 [Coprinopsis sp. MPI-PUGE-AT-0042]|nr:hypothetical protein BKA70DRAFT_1227198 [Coprinopsis sp. MPI-PUGE-AT-0042]KAH6903848.1 hypothetical protein BKA70DRAFT_1227200 [Coprinopsis sp. MPI-PUGE-AT-0042]